MLKITCIRLLLPIALYRNYNNVQLYIHAIQACIANRISDIGRPIEKKNFTDNFYKTFVLLTIIRAVLQIYAPKYIGNATSSGNAHFLIKARVHLSVSA